MELSGIFSVVQWVEDPLPAQEAGARATRVSANYAFSGGLEGTAQVDLLLSYHLYNPNDPHASHAAYTGLMRFSGAHEGQEVKFSAFDQGKFEFGKATSKLSLISDSAAGNFHSFSGGGDYQAGPNGSSWRFCLEHNTPKSR